MRKLLGAAVFVLGLGGLGWWAQGHNAHRIEHFITDHAAKAVASSVHGVTSTVSGRDIHLSGIADSAAEKAALLEAANKVPGRRVVTEDLTVLPTAAPYLLEVEKSAPEAALTASGNVPTEALRGTLGLGDAAAGLVLASGAPAGWGDLVKAGIAALGPLQSGKLLLTDGALTLTGVALGPDQAAAADDALAGLPEGSVTKDITLLDDGTPADYTLDYTAAEGASLSGKLPKGLDAGAIATALGLPKIAGEVKTALLGDAGDASPFAAFKGWLGQIEALRVTVTPDSRKAEVTVQPGTDAEGLTAALTGGGFDTTVSTATPEGENGQTRTNAASGLAERFMGGFWLAVPQVDLGVSGCQTASEGVLAGATINFVSGSDELDASAVKVINDLAGIMARCAEEAGLRAEIGGHTDSTGDAEANLGLSQKRAVAVRRELIARGVPAAALKAVGFGASDPVADNGTEEGKARNRRTTITWSE